MTKRMTAIARELFKLVGKYTELGRANGDLSKTDDFVWIRDDNTGEVIIYASSFKRVENGIAGLSRWYGESRDSAE